MLLLIVVFMTEVPTVLDSNSDVADMPPVMLSERLELCVVGTDELANGAEFVIGTEDAVTTALPSIEFDGDAVVAFMVELAKEVVAKVVFGNGTLGGATTVGAVISVHATLVEVEVEVVDVVVFQPGVIGMGRVTVVPSKVSTRVV